MNTDSTKTFLTYYLQALNERTRREKNGPKWGIDWVVYNIGMARFGKAVRLPFLRAGVDGYPKSKVEAEFGVDLAFLSDDRKSLVIFVLKDEPLTNATWISDGFDRDLRMATFPDLDADDMKDVAKVKIILAYNKDEERNGVELFDRLVADSPRVLRDAVDLAFDRWNLSTLVEETLHHVLSPSLLPERFFGQLSYLGSQAAEFPHGSDRWETQLVPAWRRFIDDVLTEGGHRGISLIPVALIILREQATENVSFETGWLDLIEWAAIALWRHHADHPGKATRVAVDRFWSDFYLTELHGFYSAHIATLGVEKAIDQLARSGYVGSVGAAYVMYWHLGRVGILAAHLCDRVSADEGEKRAASEALLQVVANWIALLVNANTSALRPTLDVHHIQLFLVLHALWRAGRQSDVATFIGALQGRLYMRRLGKSPLPFLDGSNSLENVFEQVAAQPKEPVVSTSSSFFILALMEMCRFASAPDRDRLVELTHRRLVLGRLDNGELGDRTPLDLMSWIPALDWPKKVLRGEGGDGTSVTIPPFADSHVAPARDLLIGVRRVIEAMREVVHDQMTIDVPRAALLLASLRFGTPLPPEFWRAEAFPGGAEAA
jgi:hypothetical protein